MNNPILKIKKGFSIVEALVAISIVSLAITSATAVVQGSLQNSQITRFRIQSIHFANEAVEFARNLRDTDIVSEKTFSNGELKTFVNACNSDDGCFLDVLNNTYGKCNKDGCDKIYLTEGVGYNSDENGNETPFKRRVTVNEISGDEISVTVDVSFSVRGYDETVSVTSYLMNHE